MMCQGGLAAEPLVGQAARTHPAACWVVGYRAGLQNWGGCRRSPVLVLAPGSIGSASLQLSPAAHKSLLDRPFRGLLQPSDVVRDLFPPPAPCSGGDNAAALGWGGRALPLGYLHLCSPPCTPALRRLRAGYLPLGTAWSFEQAAPRCLCVEQWFGVMLPSAAYTEGRWA